MKRKPASSATASTTAVLPPPPRGSTTTVRRWLLLSLEASGRRWRQRLQKVAPAELRRPQFGHIKTGFPCAHGSGWGAQVSHGYDERPCRIVSGAGCGDLAEAGNNVAGVGRQRLLLVAVHQVDVELVDARIGQGRELGAVLVDRSDHAEAIDHVVGDKLRVVGADFCVVQVVVALAVADVGGQTGR